MEILIFAIIAVGIFYKLHKQLGKIDEEEKRTIESKVSLMKKMQDEFVKKLEDSVKKSVKNDEKIKETNQKIKDLKNILSNITRNINMFY